MPRHLFEKGHPKLPNSGRRAGTPNKASKAVKGFLRECAEDPDVQDAFKGQLQRGDKGEMQAFLLASSPLLSYLAIVWMLARPAIL